MTAETQIIYDYGDQKDTDPTVLSSEKKQIEMGIRVRIDQLIDVDTSAQQYNMTAIFDKTWLATKKDIAAFNKNGKEYIPETVPKIDLKNCVDSGNIRYQTWANGNVFTLKNASDTEQYYNCQRIKFSGRFTEEFELNNFPFDVQDLSIVIGNPTEPSKYFKFVPDRTHSDYISIDKTWCSATEWSIENVGARTTDVDLVFARSNGERSGSDKQIFPYVVFRIQAARRWKSVFFGIILWMTLLGILSFCIFGYEATDINGRLSFAVTMILTIVAFQFVISSELPNVPYLTLIDKYNFSIFIFVLSISVETVVVGYHNEGIIENVDAFDDCFAFAAAVLFVVAHIGFALFCYVKYKFERSKLRAYIPLKVRMLARFRQDLDKKNPNQFRRLPREEEFEEGLGREYSLTQTSLSGQSQTGTMVELNRK